MICFISGEERGESAENGAVIVEAIRDMKRAMASEFLVFTFAV